MGISSRTKVTIEKLLRQSVDRSVTPEEAEAFRAKAFDLMAREGLTESDLAGADEGAEIGRLEIDMQVTYGHAYGAAFARVATALHCSYTYGKFAHRAVVFGRRRHLDRLEFLWPLLHGMATTQMISMRGVSAASTRRKRISFLYALMDSVAERLDAIDYSLAAEEARASGKAGHPGAPGTALDFASDRTLADSARDEWLVANGYVLSSSRGSSAVLDPDAVAEGRRAGGRVDIGNSRLDGGPRQLSA